MIVEFLEEYRSQSGKWYRPGEIADLPEGEARVLVRTGRAKEFKVGQEPQEPSE